MEFRDRPTRDAVAEIAGLLAIAYRWVGGIPMLGYDLSDKGAALVVNEDEAARVRAIFDLYLEHRSLIPVVQELIRRGWRMKEWTTRKGTVAGGPWRPQTDAGHAQIISSRLSPDAGGLLDLPQRPSQPP